MTTADRIIADLMTALDAIRRETQKPAEQASFAYIEGIAQQAMKNCDVYRVRNEHGYLVVR